VKSRLQECSTPFPEFPATGSLLLFGGQSVFFFVITQSVRLVFSSHLILLPLRNEIDHYVRVPPFDNRSFLKRPFSLRFPIPPPVRPYGCINPQVLSTYVMIPMFGPLPPPPFVLKDFLPPAFRIPFFSFFRLVKFSFPFCCLIETFFFFFFRNGPFDFGGWTTSAVSSVRFLYPQTPFPP